jgi:hypothetical protein
MSNATTITAVFGGLSDSGDLAELERLCGRRRVQRASTHHSADRPGRSITVSWDYGPVLAAADIRTLASGVALLLWGKLPPILAAQPKLSDDPDWPAVQAEESEQRALNDRARKQLRDTNTPRLDAGCLNDSDGGTSPPRSEQP